MSYPISGQNPGYKHAGYQVDTPIIPHGVSVAVSAPAVFRFTGPSNPERHLQAAEAFGVDISNVKRESAGEVLGEALTKFLADLGDQPKGLKDLGFKREHLGMLISMIRCYSFLSEFQKTRSRLVLLGILQCSANIVDR